MLAFDDEFRLTSSRNCCALWADEPTFKRVRFSVNTQILSNRPKGSNPLHEFAELELCERERDQIESACRRLCGSGELRHRAAADRLPAPLIRPRRLPGAVTGSYCEFNDLVEFGWRAPLALMVALMIPQIIAGLAAGRDRQV